MDLMARRRMMIAKKALPYDAEVEYLESSGTQWIDTGYIMTSDVVEYGIVIKNHSTYISGKSFFGSEISATPAYSGVPYSINGQVIRLYIGSTGGTASVTLTSEQDNEYIISTSSSTSGKLTLNGAEQSFTYSNGIQKSNSVYLFANNKSGAIQICSIKCGGFYIKDNNVLVRNFIPVRIGQVGYMYDTVSGRLFGNDGSGDFILGPDI